MDSYLSAYCICISWSISLLTLGYGVLAAGYHVCGTTARFAQLGDRYIVYFHTCSAPDPRTQCCSPDSQYISSAWLVKNGTNQTSLSHNISHFWVSLRMKCSDICVCAISTVSGLHHDIETWSMIVKVKLAYQQVSPAIPAARSVGVWLVLGNSMVSITFTDQIITVRNSCWRRANIPLWILLQLPQNFSSVSTG